MPNLTEKSQSIQVAKVLTILNLAARNDITLKEACQQEGIAYPTFHRWYSSRKDEIVMLIDTLAIARVSQITLMAKIYQDALERIGQRVEFGLLDTSELLAVMKYIKTDLADALTATGGFDETQEQQAQAYAESLTGPQLKEVENRFVIKSTDRKTMEIQERDVIEGDYTDIVD